MKIKKKGGYQLVAINGPKGLSYYYSTTTTTTTTSSEMMGCENFVSPSPRR